MPKPTRSYWSALVASVLAAGRLMRQATMEGDMGTTYKAEISDGDGEWLMWGTYTDPDPDAWGVIAQRVEDEVLELHKDFPEVDWANAEIIVSSDGESYRYGIDWPDDADPNGTADIEEIMSNHTPVECGIYYNGATVDLYPGVAVVSFADGSRPEIHRLSEDEYMEVYEAITDCMPGDANCVIAARQVLDGITAW